MLLAVRGLSLTERIFDACLPTVKRWEVCMFHYHIVLLMSVNMYIVNLTNTIFLNWWIGVRGVLWCGWFSC